jgi:glycosyltransferase involved in cell wall biosynthesis
MFPMKFFEYLAAGIPVVATDIPALAEFGDIATLTTRDEMVAAIERVLGGDVPDAGVRQAAVHDNTYSARTRRMLAAAGLH